MDPGSVSDQHTSPNTIEPSAPGKVEQELRKAILHWLRARRDTGAPIAEILQAIGVIVELDDSQVQLSSQQVANILWEKFESFIRNAPIEELLLLVSNLKLVERAKHRRRLEHFTSLDDVVAKLNSDECKNVVVLTGAGISVSCGIPDFRSEGGIYDMVEASDFELPDPQLIFDIEYFKDTPQPFFQFCKKLLPGHHKPSLAHHFIRLLESKGKLLRNYTQNIDTLEAICGIDKVIYCHGCFKTASCILCKRKVDIGEIQEDIEAGLVPSCTKCGSKEAFMKPDIIFFGESLPPEFQKNLEDDLTNADLLIVMGSSLRVRPVCLIPALLDEKIPQVLVNRELVGLAAPV